MSKAEQRALEAYPPKYVEQERHSKRMQSEKVDTHQPMRAIYIKGYHQAEKDLELTWEDLALIRLAFDATEDNINHGCLKISPMTKEYYEEVLKRFKERKK